MRELLPRRILPLLLLATLLKLSSSTSTNCLSDLTYRQFEKLILTNDNIQKLEECFYPVNYHRKDIVNITYEVTWPVTSYNNDTCYNDSYITFHWLLSPIHLIINHEILQGLSLQTYVPEISNTTLHINLTELCPDVLKTVVKEFTLNNMSQKDVCNKHDLQVLKILNQFTANVS